MRRIDIMILWLVFLIVPSAFPLQTPISLGPKDGVDLPPADLTRIKVGDKAPDFTLEDQDGKPVTLSSYRGNRSTVLVFYRGYW